MSDLKDFKEYIVYLNDLCDMFHSLIKWDLFLFWTTIGKKSQYYNIKILICNQLTKMSNISNDFKTKVLS